MRNAWIGAVLLVACGGGAAESGGTTTGGVSGDAASAYTFESTDIQCAPGGTVAPVTATECNDGGNEPEMIRARLADGFGSLGAVCTVGGTITVHFRINGNGEVASAAIASTTATSTADDEHVLELVRGTDFCAYADGRPRDVDFPFNLIAPDPAAAPAAPPASSAAPSASTTAAR